MDFTTLSGEALTAALALDFAATDNEALAAALADRRTAATALFALETATVAQADDAEALTASLAAIEAEQKARAERVKDAEKRFAAARDAFSADDGADDEGTDDDEANDEATEDGADDEGTDDGADDEGTDDADDGGTDDGADDDGADATVTAAVDHSKTQRISTARRVGTARKVGAKTKRPDRESTNPVTITAAADIPGFGTGSVLDGMTEVAKAVQSRVSAFSKFNKNSAMALRSQRGTDEPMLQKYGVASFAVPSTNDLTERSSQGAEYDAMGEAVKAHVKRVSDNMDLAVQGKDAALAAAMAWCAPSEVVYNWIADFNVDGLKTLPEISAPRGGLWLTEGPQLLQENFGEQDDFGFGGTETEMEAGYVKTCETIVCPDFEEFRLDFDGYCWKMPILTEKTFPEVIADALRYSDVQYAHKMNSRIINDILAESVARDAHDVYGGSVLDTLEALVQIATKERRYWNLGKNAVLEVTLPDYAEEIFKFDMSRRSGLALNDIATSQKVAALFANYRLSVEYVSDFGERATKTHPTAGWPDTIPAIMYPAGTFVKAQFDVINLSAVYDATSLSHNEYTGVFYEQGIKVIRRGYRSTKVTIPVCTAGAMGGMLPVCSAQDSF